MRQQRCGYNPLLRDSCHTQDGYIIYHPTLDSTHIDVHGGWHDASDYLQYVTTSATAVYQLLYAYQENPFAFKDHYDAAGDPGTNGLPDVLDEARWGLEWLIRMNPKPGMLFNQIADDRDHLGFRLPTEDTISYGRGLERPVYFCSGEPQGIFKHSNRTTGIASTAGKYASAFALGSTVFEDLDGQFARRLLRRAEEAYAFGTEHPGVCQTAPCRAPYFYEEEDWTDDMELAAAQLYATTGSPGYRIDALSFARRQPVKPWMGADTARHYEWYPFVNMGHLLLAADHHGEEAREPQLYLKAGLENLYRKGRDTPFLFGVPFIWCSNNLVAAALTQLRAYHTLTRDTMYLEMEAALRDWLFGCNPWGTSMIVGYPEHGDTPIDPHSAFTHLYGYPITGGLVDGPFLGSNLIGVGLADDDEYAEFQSDLAVYHDDVEDYSTNEPTMDGTASLSYYLSSLEMEGQHDASDGRSVVSHGGIVRMNPSNKEIFLVFTGHEFSDGAEMIRETLREHDIRASFFFTGDFYRSPGNAQVINILREDSHYLGAHSDKHLLYCSWEQRDSLLISQQEFLKDVRDNYKVMKEHGIGIASARYFMPPYEWYNDSISTWCRRVGLALVNFTPGTSSNADYTTPDMGPRYLSSDTIMHRILSYEQDDPNGLNGFILLLHIGTDPLRSDKLYLRLDELLEELTRRGYQFRSFAQL
jgi:peptidoglycan/xylan/chitin deacetylase (PgdA/CDA1 family)